MRNIEVHFNSDTETIKVTELRHRHRCFYCNKGWIVLRWTPVLETPWSPSRWVCLHHTRKHWKEG